MNQYDGGIQPVCFRVSRISKLIFHTISMFVLPVYHIAMMGFFMGSVSPAGLSEGAFRAALSNIEQIERNLNNGLSGREVLESIPRPSVPPPRPSVIQSGLLLDKINKCAFRVDAASLKGPEDVLTCPITLCIPEDGVFMKNAGNSSICTLYDKASLEHLVNTNAPHPLSRESITVSMIVERDKCNFDFQRQCFIAK
ncbi:T3SS effector NleG family protein [Escherichia albertii]